MVAPTPKVAAQPTISRCRLAGLRRRPGAGRCPWRSTAACTLKSPERLDMVALNMAASMIPTRPLGSRVSDATAYEASCGLARPGQTARRSGIQHAHGQGRDEPDEGAQDEEREAEERDLLRGPLVVHAEVALGHGRGVVAKAHHEGPAGRRRASPSPRSGGATSSPEAGRASGRRGRRRARGTPTTITIVNGMRITACRKSVMTTAHRPPITQ